MNRQRPGTETNVGFDALIAVGLAVLSLVTLWFFNDALDNYTTEPNWFASALILVQTLPLTLRRKYPTPVLAIVAVGFIVERLIDYPSTESTFAVAFALHAVGSDLMPRRTSMIVGWSAVVGLTAFTALGVAVGQVPVITVIIMGALTSAAFLLGREVHTRRSYQLTLEKRTERLLAEREARAREAVLEERTRIARELHDVVAHEMTVMTIQAAAGQRVFETSPDESKRALAAIEQAGHEGLTEMRRLIHFLRDSTASATSPQPGVARVPDLAAQMVEAGLPVALTISGDVIPLPPGLDLNAYRIIQESLTNVLKHGGPSARATVSMEYLPDELRIEVVDDGRGAAEALVSANGSGQGLVGMRQRADLFGGTIEAGPKPGGGYRVVARLPSPRS
jgi:signal transduction histidine kinase